MRSTRRRQVRIVAGMRAALRRWGLLGLIAGASLGCSFVIDLEGPGFVEITYPDDVGLPPTVDASEGDATVTPDAGPLDATSGPGNLTPTLPEFDLTLSAAAPVIVHGSTGLVRAKLDQSDRFRVRIADGEAVTARFGDSTLVTLTGLRAGAGARVDRPTQTTRTATMRIQVPSPYPGASGYVMTNGCRHLSCEGEECALWMDGERSLSVTNACAPSGEVRTLVIATQDGQPIGWAHAFDPFPDSANAEPTFGQWRDDFTEVLIHATGVENPDAHGLPWADYAFDTDIAPRRTDAGRLAVLIPESFSDVTQFGLDVNPPWGAALGRPQQGMRTWRRTDVTLPVVLEASRLPAVPTVTVDPDPDGARPTIRWQFGDAPVPEGLARIEFLWEADDASLEWILFAPASAGALRLPHLPPEWARLSPPDGALGRAAQVTIVQCLGNGSLSDHYRDPCPVYGPGSRDAVVQDVRWSAGFIEGADDREGGAGDEGE